MPGPEAGAQRALLSRLRGHHGCRAAYAAHRGSRSLARQGRSRHPGSRQRVGGRPVHGDRFEGGRAELTQVQASPAAPRPRPASPLLPAGGSQEPRAGIPRVATTTPRVVRQSRAAVVDVRRRGPAASRCPRALRRCPQPGRPGPWSRSAPTHERSGAPGGGTADRKCASGQDGHLRRTRPDAAGEAYGAR